MCCNSSHIENCLPSEFEHSKQLQSVKNNILNDQPHRSCNSCYDLEKQGLTSIRQNAIKDYAHLNKDNITNKIVYYDLRYSNLCNFSCRTCSPDFSSSIGNEITDNKNLQRYYNLTVPRKNIYANIESDIKKNLGHVERLMFTGGEPLLIKDNLKILENLVLTNNTNCEILITTNCSVMNHDWLKIIKEFNNVHWTLSIDGVGSSAEYIRNGTNWPTIVKNIQSILQLKHSASFNTTISAYSVLDLSKLVEFFIDCKKIAQGPFELWFGSCQWPKYLNPSVLTGNLAIRARQELEKSIQLLSTVNDNPLQSIDNLKNTIKLLNTCDAKTISVFNNFTKELDLVRNQSFSKTFNLENPYV